MKIRDDSRKIKNELVNILDGFVSEQYYTTFGIKAKSYCENSLAGRIGVAAGVFTDVFLLDNILDNGPSTAAAIGTVKACTLILSVATNRYVLPLFGKRARG